MNHKARPLAPPGRFLKTSCFLAAACFTLVARVPAQTDNEIPLWPLAAPQAKSAGADDNPAILLYLPAAHHLTPGIVICPSGDYMSLSMDHDGRQVAEWLNKLGIAAFVLRYRIAPAYHYPVPLLDAQRAVRYVRSSASLYNVAANEIGIMGFSAGGHLAAMAATRFDAGKTSPGDRIDRMSSRPDFLILAYPLITCSQPFRQALACSNLLGENANPNLDAEVSAEKYVTRQTPPTFLFHSYDDPTMSVENSLAFFSALRAAGVPAELHIFEHGPHSVGATPDDPVLSTWPKLLENWFRERGLLPKAVTP
jgi:acetyl esterase/lipase